MLTLRLGIAAIWPPQHQKNGLHIICHGKKVNIIFPFFLYLKIEFEGPDHRLTFIIYMHKEITVANQKLLFNHMNALFRIL